MSIEPVTGTKQFSFVGTIPILGGAAPIVEPMPQQTGLRLSLKCK
jgi:hypothetical protein